MFLGDNGLEQRFHHKHKHASAQLGFDKPWKLLHVVHGAGTMGLEKRWAAAGSDRFES